MRGQERSDVFGTESGRVRVSESESERWRMGWEENTDAKISCPNHQGKMIEIIQC